MKYLRWHALEGKIKIEVSQEELAEALNVSPYSNIDIDKSVKKYFKSKGIKIIDCDLNLVASGGFIKRYKKERKNKWYSNSYPVEFVQELPKDKILIIMHKYNHEMYIITDIVKNISIPVAMLTPLCCIDQRVNREKTTPLMSLFDNYKVFSLHRLSDIRKINSYEFND